VLADGAGALPERDARKAMSSSLTERIRVQDGASAVSQYRQTVSATIRPQYGEYANLVFPRASTLSPTVVAESWRRAGTAVAGHQV
jgi:hypothetical protein